MKRASTNDDYNILISDESTLSNKNEDESQLKVDSTTKGVDPNKLCIEASYKEHNNELTSNAIATVELQTTTFEALNSNQYKFHSYLSADYEQKCNDIGRIEKLETELLLTERKLYQLEYQLNMRQQLSNSGYEHCILKEINQLSKIRAENCKLKQVISQNQLKEIANEHLGSRNINISATEEFLQFKKLLALTDGLRCDEIAQKLNIAKEFEQTFDDMRLTLDVSKQSLIVVRSRLKNTENCLRNAEHERDRALNSIMILEKAFDSIQYSCAVAHNNDYVNHSKITDELLNEIRGEFNRIKDHRQQVILLSKQYCPVMSTATNTDQKFTGSTAEVYFYQRKDRS
ncbi:hypothetical protein GJ496_010019 [Pomphorhynchus laevis]|nr:hypothetical protein GJ496_010019 [Pomphorhynchus laevis]